MSQLKTLDTESRLYAISERMAQVRLDLTNGKITPEISRSMQSSLTKEYQSLKHESENLQIELSDWEESELLTSWDTGELI